MVEVTCWVPGSSYVKLALLLAGDGADGTTMELAKVGALLRSSWSSLLFLFQYSGCFFHYFFPYFSMMFRYWMFRCFGVLMNRRVWSEAVISIISHLRLLSWRVLHGGFYDCSLALRPRPLPTSCAGKGFLQENVACRSWKKLSCETQCDRFDLGLCIIYSLMRLCWWRMWTSCRICRKTSSSAKTLASQIRNSYHIESLLWFHWIVVFKHIPKVLNTTHNSCSTERQHAQSTEVRLQRCPQRKAQIAHIERARRAKPWDTWLKRSLYT